MEVVNMGILKNSTNEVNVNFGDGTWTDNISGYMTPKQIDQQMTEKDGIDLITTLENYLDHAWLDMYSLEIVNDYKVYTTTLEVLTNGVWLYSYINKQYGF